MSAPSIHSSSVIGPRVALGAHTRIGPGCRIDGDTTIGKNVDIGAGVTLAGDATIGDGCILEPGVTMTDADTVGGRLVLGGRVCVGAGGRLACGISIGYGARLAAGTKLVRDVPAHAIVEGDPARVVGFGAPVTNASRLIEGNDSHEPIAHTTVRGVAIHRLPMIREPRGNLTVGEFDDAFPFQPKRHFLVTDVPAAELRGGHVHLSCAELLICARGALAVVVDDGAAREEITLDTPDLALHLPAGVWATQYRHAPGTALLVFASHRYDPGGYIRDYELFLAQAGA